MILALLMRITKGQVQQSKLPNGATPVLLRPTSSAIAMQELCRFQKHSMQAVQAAGVEKPTARPTPQHDKPPSRINRPWRPWGEAHGTSLCMRQPTCWVTTCECEWLAGMYRKPLRKESNCSKQGS